MAKSAKKSASMVLLLGALGVTGYTLYKSINKEKEKKKRVLQLSEERLGLLFDSVTNEYIDFLTLWVNSPQYADQLPSIINCDLEPHLEDLLRPFEKPPVPVFTPEDRTLLRQMASSGFDKDIRMHMWLHVLGFPEIRQFVQKYHNLYHKFEEQWNLMEENEHNREFHSELIYIKKDLPRTFSPDGESLNEQKQLALRNVLGVYAIADVEISYVQGMNMLAYQILQVCDGHEDISFAILCQLMKLNDRGCELPRRPVEEVFEGGNKNETSSSVVCEYAYCAGGNQSKNGVEGYGFRFMFTKCLPGCIISLIMFDELVFELLPHVHEILHMHNITPQFFASEWFFTLFTYVIKEKEVLNRIWDLFLVDGYKALFRVGLAILSRSYINICDSGYEEVLYFLKRFPERSIFVDESDVRSGDAFIKEAMSFKITNRTLSLLATSILEDGRFNQNAV